MKDRVKQDIGTKEQLQNWSDINWKTAKKRVKNLRRRIYRATANGQWNKVRSLMKLMLRSYSNQKSVSAKGNSRKPGKIDGWR
ncbi:reverse transcriptase N-terminal domain-containing protein [Tolypothrix sp. VBCCA 56010]|uniref:reverse transcriptase N-terminal domain-containing protein n=1 Tax=Tolypothrix sp. VBCCA 56010 TaxID=3137731 RepID=UPI003D7C4C40